MWFVTHPFLWRTHLPWFCVVQVGLTSSLTVLPGPERSTCQAWVVYQSLVYQSFGRQCRLDLALFPGLSDWLMDDNVTSAGPDDAIGMMSFPILCDCELKAQYKLELLAHPNDILSLVGENEPSIAKKSKTEGEPKTCYLRAWSSHTWKPCSRPLLSNMMATSTRGLWALEI